jgi:hypothetical protein
MTIHEAVEMAITGGDYAPTIPLAHESFPERILLDPAFWQALGKAQRWPAFFHRGAPASETILTWCKKREAETGEPYLGQVLTPGWLHHWHGFIDHLAANQDPASFFSSLHAGPLPTHDTRRQSIL